MRGNRLSDLEKQEWQASEMLEYYPKLQQYCQFLTQNKYDGEDVAQDVMVKAFLKYEQEKISTALLNKMAYHHWVDVTRKRKKESIGELPELSARDHASRMNELSEMIDHLMAKCTPKQAVLFLLKEGFQYQARELAEMLETSETAIKSALFRAKKRLAKDKKEADSFWDEEERELLSDLMYTSLQFQDPSPLLQALPDILTFEGTESPALILTSVRPLPSFSSSASLCMAA
ncbi:sigma factor-like helix-turn-helix DNA-binding protein [Peribacillus frigoritolerans]|uniref:sigma factor-like helix-turn-helix DNA-binding protein n=1 Tax=Peribacillus frigoritolerans TaxID=450367 RepID=UPI00105A73E5|nr:sigma factor-like helix-turn-helix DNA-binding protein [Peribacillus frigoritolerans]TDL80433.1 RNA polymerase subunit sigma [Peribacillus frigoritolerans]